MTYLNETEISELVTGLQAKSLTSFTALYDRYSAALYGVSYKMLRNKPLAEDILQEVFIKIWKNIDKYDARKGTLFTWMLRITSNTCKDYFRSSGHHYQMIITGDNLETLDLNRMPHQAVYQHENSDVYQLIQKLDIKYQQVIDLVYICGYSHVEAADILNIPVGTIKTRSRTALKILRNLYY